MSSSRRLRSSARTSQPPRSEEEEPKPMAKTKPKPDGKVTGTSTSTSKSAPVKRKLAESEAGGTPDESMDSKAGSMAKLTKDSGCEPRPGPSGSGKSGESDQALSTKAVASNPKQNEGVGLLGEMMESKSKQKQTKKYKKVHDSDPQQGPSTSGIIDSIHQAARLVSVSEEAAKVMHNELVLDTIAMKLPTGNLLSLRQTCTAWNRSIVSKLATQHKQILLRTDISDERRYPNRKGLISKYTKVMESSANIPFQNYFIHDFRSGRPQDIKHFFSICGNTITRLRLTLDLDSVVQATTIQTVREIVFEWTPQLRELTICPNVLPYHFSRLGSSSATSTTKSESQPEMLKKDISNLRKLTLKGAFTHRENSEYQLYFTLLEDLFQCAVGLASVSIDGGTGMGIGIGSIGQWDLNDILHSISGQGDEFPTAALARIKYLSVSSLEASHLRLLIKLGSCRQNSLQLQELKTSIAGFTNQATNAEMMVLSNDFLATQSKTLRRLNISVDGVLFGDNIDDFYKSKIGVRLPSMEKVQSLGLIRDKDWQIAAQCDHGTFESNFPGLKNLYLCYDYDPGSDYMEDGEPVFRVPVNEFAHGGVTSLKLELAQPRAHKTVSPDVDLATPLSVLPLLWPSVSKLDLELTHETFNTLSSFWTLWPGLISLRVELRSPGSHSTTELDEMLAGIPASQFADLRQQLRKLGPELDPTIKMDCLRVLQSQFKTLPGISNLKQLQEFVLDTTNKYKQSFNITDIGGYMGFAMMSSPAVQHLALIRRDEDQHSKTKTEAKKESEGNCISKECRTFMRSIFGPYAVLEL